MNFTFTSEDHEWVDPRVDPCKHNLLDIKVKIDPVEKEWDHIKKSIHEYEYVYSSSYCKHNIANVIPISRSFFKLKEILSQFKIQVESTSVIVCLAEAPGGFIQCLRDIGDMEIHGITLVSKDKKIPYWNRFLQTDPHLKFHVGVTGDGDLYHFGNMLSFIRGIGLHTADLITGDGGFDNSGDYNNQEDNSFPLIYAEIYLTLYLQKKGGVFVCKLFDTFEERTIRILDILRRCYRRISFYKPCLSRISNSEKYVVCLGYLGCPVDLLNEMTHHFQDHHLQNKVSQYFLKEIQEFNQLYVGTQTESIQQGLDKIYNREFTKHPTPHQLSCAKEWCQTYKVPMNT